MHQIYITTYQGLEDTLFDEIVELGIPKNRVKIVKRGVSVSDCSLKEVYQFNYELRCAIRVLINLASFQIREVKDLHWKSKSINWHQWFEPNQTFKVDGIVNNSEEFNNPKYAAQVTKDGIVDCFKNTKGERPDVDTYNPDIVIQVLVSKNNVTISLDSSGDSLHKRNYKSGSFRAPLSEVLAAGMVKKCGFKNGMDLYDPMCGSGTLLTEGYQIACKTPAGKYRDWWAFENWSVFKEEDFIEVKENAAKKEEEFKGNLYYGDQYLANVEMTEDNLKAVGYYKMKEHSSDFFHSTKPSDSGIIVMNPPYDVRLELNESKAFYKQIGDQFKQQFSGWNAGVFSGNIPALKALGLKPSRRIPLWNGPIEGRLNMYDMY